MDRLDAAATAPLRAGPFHATWMPMLIVCPACSASYRLDVDTLGMGRKVRCARCRAEWFVGGDDPVSVDLPPAAASGAMGAEPPPQAGPPDRGTPDPTALPSAAGAALQARQDPHPDDDDLIDADHDGVDRTADHKYAWLKRRVDRPTARAAPARAGWGKSSAVKRPRRSVRLRPAAVFAACGAAAIAVAFVARADVVRRAPALASLYGALGLEVNVRGLAIRDVRSVEEIEEGVPILLVTGAIANVARGLVDVPRLRLAVMAADGRELYSWTTVAGRTKLSPDETAPFRARLASPPAEGRAVAVRFLARQDLAANAY